MDSLLIAFITGIGVGMGATVVMDLWSIARSALLEMAPPNYALVGRWIGHMKTGRFRHDSIVASPPIRHERLIGWVIHYLIGISFAGILLSIWGLRWIQEPTLMPALMVGIATVAAPFLIMQPGMGAGFAASRTPHPASARLHSIINHAVFGVGLYVAGWGAHWLSSL